MKNKCFFLIVLIIALLCAASQTVFAENYRFAHITMGRGLSNNSVYCLKQDYRGFMWLGTFSGLNKFDGTTFTIYKPESKPGSISSSVIFTLYEDSQKRLWVGTDGGGLNLYDRDNDNFITFRHNTDDPFSISSDQVYAVLEDDSGILWAGTDGGGLNRMTEEGGFISYGINPDRPRSLKSNTVRSLFKDSKGRMLIGTEGGGLSLPEPGYGNFKTYLHDPQKPESIQSNTVRTIFEDKSGRIWIGMENGGVSEFDPDTGTFRPLYFPEVAEITQISVRALSEDPAGRLWIGTEDRGIFIYTHKSDTWERVSSSRYVSGALSNNRIRSFFTDSNSQLWIGTRDGGANIFNYLAFHFNFISGDAGGENLRNHQIREIIEAPDGKIWIAADGGGLNLYDRQTGRVKTFKREDNLKSSLSDNQCYSLCYDAEGFLWVGTDGGGINLFDIKAEKWIRNFRENDSSGLSSNVVWDLFIDSNGDLWAGTEGGGLNLYDRQTETFTSFQFEPGNQNSLNGNSVRDIIEDSAGRIWVGTWDGGLSLFDRSSRSFTRFQFNPERAHSLSDNSVNCIFEDSAGRIWIGTAGGGLNLYNEEYKTFTAYRTIDGLASDNVLGIVEDKDNDLWITTDNGLSLFNPVNNFVNSFTREDGLQGNEFTQKAFTITADGAVFIGGTNGVNYFYPEKIKGRKYNPPLILTDYKILNKTVQVGDTAGKIKLLEKSITETDRVVLSQDEKVISFSFSVIDFLAPEKSRYYAFLDGFDSDWNFLGNKNNVTYTSLPHGEYILKIKGINHTGQSAAEELRLGIKILPYFWQTWLFRIAAALFLAASVYAIIRYRTLSLKRHNEELSRFSQHIQNAREEERKSAARDVHDELGQLLTALKIDIYQFSKKQPQQEQKEKTENMLQLINMALDSVKSLSTRLRPKALDTLSLSEALQWQTVDFQKRTDIKCEFRREELPEYITPDVSTAVFRIYQEILTNILRHSGADRVEIDIFTDQQNINLKVSDNGTGIPAEKLASPYSYGLIGMRERCRRINGSLKITTAYKEGTIIEAVIPAAGTSLEADKYFD